MIAINPATCTGCGTCVRVCPHRVLELENHLAILAAEDRCIECGACQVNCHEDAVMVTKGTGCLFAIARDELLGPRSGDACGAGCG